MTNMAKVVCKNEYFKVYHFNVSINNVPLWSCGKRIVVLIRCIFHIQVLSFYLVELHDS